MRTVYVDSDFKCHPNDNGNMKAVETDFFDGKCDTFVEGHCYEDKGTGCVAVYPWKDSQELDMAQRQYEKQLIAIYEESLKTLGVEV